MKTLILLMMALFSVSALAATPLYTPQEAVHDALSGELEFVGIYVPRYSESGLPSALLKNDRAVLSVDYCTKNTASAASIRIHSIDRARGNVKFYAEVKPGRDISRSQRADYYDQTWSIGARPNASGFSINGTAAAYNTYVEKEAQILNGCVTGYSSRVFCKDGFSDQSDEWGRQSYAFWKKPSSDWYRLLTALRAFCSSH